MIRCLTAFAFLLMTAAPCLAEVRLPKVIGSHMVLQRETEVRVWGWAEPSEAVRVGGDWLDRVLATTADDQGRWEVQLPTAKAGGPHTITIQGENTITLNDVLFGEVWIASGQSNMEMPLIKVSGAYTGILNAEREVAAANHPQIRLFQVGNFSSKEPLDEVRAGNAMYGVPPAKLQWMVCSPETIPTFASTAYFFARELQQKLKVPVGIIDASWGGTPAEAWTPLDGLKQLDYSAEVKQAVELPQNPDQKIPARLYNGMIHPLRKLTIRGVIWYQGEGNSRRADKYHRLFTTMIEQWRQAFGQSFPFYYVQIAPYNYRGVNSALLREAQLDTLALEKTGMAVTMDIGNLTDIHPKNKQEVGRRLALWALANDYEQDVVYSGPLYAAISIADGRVKVAFRYADGGLKTIDGRPPSHFEIAGEDGVYHPATTALDGKHVVVWSEEVEQPTSVRYAFSNDATPNLVNQAGLPASSFRTQR